MSLPKPSGLKQPSRIGRPSGLPTARPQTPAGGSSTNQQVSGATTASKAQSAIAKSARGAGFCPQHADTYASETSKILKGPESSSEDGVVTDDFKIGDRVFVGENKPGVIAFIGETQFAPGEWAGVVLDEPIGKNDGSVMGVRYFQCETKRGVFSRLSKLSHLQHSPSDPPSQRRESTSNETKLSNSDLRPTVSTATTNGSTAPTPSVSSRPSSRLGLSASKNMSSSSSSLHKASSAGNTPTGVTTLRLPGTMPGGVRVGDRVLVSGSKCGILRYIGETDFAKGIWAGVELDEALGKNDGAVAGKRYFDCQPLHGLFAPVHKISRAGPAVLTPSPHSRPLMSTSLRSSRERSGSQESVLSGSSTASSVSRSRVRLGVTSLASQATKAGQRPSTLNLSATTAALQKALKEKEEHIEQLLRERDLERSEVARAAAHVDEAEGQLSSMRSEQDRLRMEAEDQITKYRALVAELENEKQDLTAHLEEEKRKVEDLQFQLEEETLKDDGDSKANAAFELQLKEIERQAKKEKERADGLEKDLLHLKQKLEDQIKATNDAKLSQTSYLDQIEELTYKLTQSEAKVKAFESSRLEDGAKTSQVSIELAEKHSRVKELEEQLGLQRRELSSMAQQLSDVREELIASNEKGKKQKEYIQELTNKLKQAEDENKKILEELHNANTSSADVQRQLSASRTKAEELASDRSKLELQLSELVKNSGDSSSQLTALSEQIKERNRKIEDLQNSLSSYSQNLAKVEESYQKLQQDKDREIQETCKKYDERIIKLGGDIKELNTAVDKYKTRATQLSEQFETERTEALQHKEAEIKELQQQLSQANDTLNKQQDTTTAHKQMLEKIGSEKEALQYEKQQAEKQLKRTEEEKSAINAELIQARLEVGKCQEEVEKAKGAKLELEDRVEKMLLELEYATKAKEEGEKTREEMRSQKLDLVREKDLLQQELVSLRAEVEDKEAQLISLQNEGVKLQQESSKKTEELMYRSQTEADHLKQELDSLKAVLKEIRGQLDSKDFQIAELQAEMEQNKVLLEQKELLVKEKAELTKEKEASEERCRVITEEARKHTDKAAELELEMQTLKLSEAALKKEKSTLEGRIGQLQADLEKSRQETAEALSKDTAISALASGDAVFLQLKEDAAAARGQVDFLNSVIVDLQNRNQELQFRLAAMEDSGIHTNGEFFDALDTPTQSRAPPRLFCDICDVFDLHDTEDCPKQATSDSPEPTRHHGDPKNTRPYCDICEVFGHWTDQCDDEQTF